MYPSIDRYLYRRRTPFCDQTAGVACIIAECRAMRILVELLSRRCCDEWVVSRLDPVSFAFAPPAGVWRGASSVWKVFIILPATLELWTASHPGLRGRGGLDLFVHLLLCCVELSV